MVATDTDDRRGKDATVVLRTDVFDDLTSKLGATSDIARARLIGVDRTTIHRMRYRLHTPSMDVAMRMAERLDVTVEDLFERPV